MTTTTAAATTTTTPAPGAQLYVGGAACNLCQLRWVRASYVAPYEAELFCPVRHDRPMPFHLWDVVRVEDGAGTVRFRGNIVEMRPGGVDQEGIVYIANGKRFRLENEPVRINGRGFYLWNRRGYPCDEGDGGVDSPDGDGEKWTAGQIIVDILEHALGLPGGGSDIPGHHGDACCINDTYLTAADIAGYTAADWLALNSVVGEFSVDNTSVADAISLLIGLNGGFYGWHIDPDTGNLELVDMDSLPATDIQAGELGHWQDEAGTDYRLLANSLEWSLEGVCSTISIQGQDRTTEEQPANIENSGNAGQGDLGELEHVASPWRDFAAAYRPLCQDKRHFCNKPIDDAGAYTPPDGWSYGSYGPRVYVGTDAGEKTAYKPTFWFPWWFVAEGIIAFPEAPSLDPGEKLWGWYWARVPFIVSSGPAGDAYDCYGYERTRTVYDPGFRHTSTYPQAGTADDEAAMATLAARLLELYRDVRRQGELVCDEVDWDLNLGNRYNVVNLGAAALGLTTTTTPACDPDPTAWRTLGINAVEVTWDLDRAQTQIRVANTFFMLEEYSELKRRLEMNLFSRRNLSLSQDIYDCQVHVPRFNDNAPADWTTAAPTTTTTAAPTTTTTAAPTTTTTAPATTTTTGVTTTTTTAAEGAGTTSTTTAPPTTTTTGVTTTTTTEHQPCPDESPGFCVENAYSCDDTYEFDVGAGDPFTCDDDGQNSCTDCTGNFTLPRGQNGTDEPCQWDTDVTGGSLPACMGGLGDDPGEARIECDGGLPSGWGWQLYVRKAESIDCTGTVYYANYDVPGCPDGTYTAYSDTGDCVTNYPSEITVY